MAVNLAIREPLTNTMRNVGLDCPRKMYYMIERGLRRRTMSEAIYIGSAFHRGMEERSAEAALELFEGIFPASQVEADELETKKAIVSAMVAGALDYWWQQWESRYGELQFEVPIINPRTGYPSQTYYLAGKIDEVVQDEEGLWWLVEYKTSGQTPTESFVKRLYLDTQITTYFYAAQKMLGIKLAGVIYRVARKPSIRQRKNETVWQFIDRLHDDYQNRPEFYFYEEQLYRDQSDLDEFEREMWAITQQFLFFRRTDTWPRNTSKCGDWGGCPYMPLCMGEPDALELFEQVGPNPELDSDEEDEDGAYAAD